MLECSKLIHSPQEVSIEQEAELMQVKMLVNMHCRKQA